MTDLQSLLTRLGEADLHAKLAECHPSLARGQVWCRQCGHTQKTDSRESLRAGWPKCCGFTMTIDSPEETALLRAKLSEGAK